MAIGGKVKKITRGKLEQYLRQLPHGMLMNEIIDIFTRFDVVREDYQQRLGNSTAMQIMPDIPTWDYLEHRDPNDSNKLDWLIKDLTADIERGYFLQWEAVYRKEQGLRLTGKHKRILRKLINFDDDDNQIFYIDGLPRPIQSWYEIVQQVVPKLLIEEVIAADSGFEASYDGWPNLAKALQKHGRYLSLPEGVKLAIDVVPIEIQHRLWLQYCFDALVGLGQDEELTLENERQHYRIKWFVECLQEHRESVVFLDLTLESLSEIIILPSKDQEIFIKLMLEELHLTSVKEQLANKLRKNKKRRWKNK